LYEAFIVASDSMAPTLPRGGRVLADKLVYRTEPMQRGDLVVFVNPNQRHERWIKRIVALPGDRVEVRAGRLHINGQQVPRTLAEPERQPAEAKVRAYWEHNSLAEYLILDSEASSGTVAKADFAPLQIPPGHCFVLGDNRRQSCDSRQVGPIPLVDIIGRTDLLYFPEFRRLRD
jgi:signal peptidase I